MYVPAANSITVNTSNNPVLIIRCKEFNSSITFDDPNDIVYLYHLAKEVPLLYIKLTAKKNGLQYYVGTMDELN